MDHAFKIKQSVAIFHIPREVYTVVRLLPETASGEPQYRVKSAATGGERMANTSFGRSEPKKVGVATRHRTRCVARRGKAIATSQLGIERDA